MGCGAWRCVVIASGIRGDAGGAGAAGAAIRPPRRSFDLRPHSAQRTAGILYPRTRLSKILALGYIVCCFELFHTSGHYVFSPSALTLRRTNMDPNGLAFADLSHCCDPTLVRERSAGTEQAPGSRWGQPGVTRGPVESRALQEHAPPECDRSRSSTT